MTLKKNRKTLAEKSQDNASTNKKEESENTKTLNFSPDHKGMSVEASAKLEAINAKAKGTSEMDQVAYAKSNLEMHRISAERYYAIEENKLDNKLKLLQGDTNHSSTSEKKQEEQSETLHEDSEQIRLKNDIEESEIAKSEITKDIEHIEFKHPMKPIWDKTKMITKQIAIILIFGLTAFVGYNLNQDFFTLIVGASSAGFVLSIIVGLLDAYIGHAVGEQFAAKKTQKGILYLFCGLALLTVVYLGQEAAIKQEELYNDVFSEISIVENTTDTTQEEESLHTGTLRAAFIIFLFILSAALSYDYYKVRNEILPHLVRDSLKKNLSKLNNYLSRRKGDLASIFSRKQADAKDLKDRIKTLVEKKEQLQILKNEELKKIDNLEARVIHIIHQVYTNQY